MFVENALAIVVWAPVAVNTVRVGVMLTRAAYYARVDRAGRAQLVRCLFYRSAAPAPEAVA
jgi:hypothetical protein